jgi:hypothetical protein
MNYGCLLHFLRSLARLHFLCADFKVREMYSVGAAEFAEIAYFSIYEDP